jgi:hypothetical protein
MDESAKTEISEWRLAAMAFWARFADPEIAAAVAANPGAARSVDEMRRAVQALTPPVAKLAESFGLDSTPLWDFGTERLPAPSVAFTLLKRLEAKLAAQSASNASPTTTYVRHQADKVTWAIALLTKHGRNKSAIADEIGVPRTSMEGKKWEAFNRAYDNLK